MDIRWTYHISSHIYHLKRNGIKSNVHSHIGETFLLGYHLVGHFPFKTFLLKRRHCPRSPKVIIVIATSQYSREEHRKHRKSFVCCMVSKGISGSNRWRYVSTIFLAIFCGDIPWNLGLKNRPYICRYLQFRFLKWPLMYGTQQKMMTCSHQTFAILMCVKFLYVFLSKHTCICWMIPFLGGQQKIALPLVN